MREKEREREREREKEREREEKRANYYTTYGVPAWQQK